MVVFFDIDDTLIDHTAAMRAAALALHSETDAPGGPEDFVKTWFEVHRRYYPRFLSGESTYDMITRSRVRETVDEGLSDEVADAFFRRYLEVYASAWVLFPDVLPCLDSLRGHRLGVISNGRADEQRRKLSATGIAHRFEHILISEDCGHAKPNAEIFRTACRGLRIHVAEATYVGDQYDVDVLAARNAGLRAVWLDRARTASQIHLGPIMNTLENLVDFTRAQPNRAIEPSAPGEL